MILTKEQMIENSINRLKKEVAEKSNALGFTIDIDTLTAIKEKVTGQKFYEVKPSDYMPVVVGKHAFSESILTYKDYSPGADFEGGILDGNSNYSKLESVDTAIEGVTVLIKDWAKKLTHNLIELQKASVSGNWSLIEAKEKSRFKNFQLGIQKVAFLGLVSNTNITGLLTQSDVAINTTIIDENISTMTAAEFQAFLGALLGAYYNNSNNTVLPDTFIIPTDDYLGLGVAVDETFNMKSRLQRIQEALSELTANPNFKILPLAYSQLERNSEFLGAGSGLNRYVLYRANDEESLRMDIPVDYTPTIQDTFDGFSYQSVAYAQFTGAKAYRPKEMLYFDHSL